jgi:hypothetical protein
MSHPRILLEISTEGIIETGIVAQTAAENEFAYTLLGMVAFELRALKLALKAAGESLAVK